MQNQLDLLLLSIPVEADGECLGCQKQRQGHVCPEDQLHWTKFPNERMGENCTVAEEVGETVLEQHSCNINAPLKDDLSGTSENV